MAIDCFIESWIMKNKTLLWFLVSIIGVWVISAIGLMTFKWWYFDLSWHDSRISLSNIIGLGATIGAIAVAVFAWTEYKNTIVQQKTKEFIWENRRKIIVDNLRSICDITNKSQITFELIKRSLQQYFINLSAVKEEIAFYNVNYKIWIADIDKLLGLIATTREDIITCTSNFAILSLFGINENELKKLQACLLSTSQAINDYAELIRQAKDALIEANSSLNLPTPNSSYEQKISEFMKLNLDPYKNEKMDEAYKNLMNHGEKILFKE